MWNWFEDYRIIVRIRAKMLIHLFNFIRTNSVLFPTFSLRINWKLWRTINWKQTELEKKRIGNNHLTMTQYEFRSSYFSLFLFIYLIDIVCLLFFFCAIGVCSVLFSSHASETVRNVKKIHIAAGAFFLLSNTMNECVVVVVEMRKKSGGWLYIELGLRHYGTGITNTNAQSNYTNSHPGERVAVCECKKKSCHP